MKRTEIINGIVKAINRKLLTGMVDAIYEHDDDGCEYVTVHARWFNYTIEATVEGELKDLVFMKNGLLIDLPNIAEAVGKRMISFDDKDVRREYYEKIQDEHAWEETMAYLNRVSQHCYMGVCKHP